MNCAGKNASSYPKIYASHNGYKNKYMQQLTHTTAKMTSKKYAKKFYESYKPSDIRCISTKVPNYMRTKLFKASRLLSWEGNQEVGRYPNRFVALLRYPTKCYLVTNLEIFLLFLVPCSTISANFKHGRRYTILIG